MLVVDRTVFAQLQADHTGIDFMELSANLIRAQRLQTGSNPSILESEATSKGLSPTSIDFLPPAYEDIFGAKNSDLPPSYSEISMMFRNMSVSNSVVSVSGRVPLELENVVNSDNARNNRDFADKNGISYRNATNDVRLFIAPTLRTSSSAPFVFKEEDNEFTSQLREFRHGFSSLENNIERNDSENDYKINNKRRNAENNGTSKEVCSGSGFNQNTINKRLCTEPNVGNCSSPENEEAKNKLNGGNNSAPCNSVQYLQSSSSSCNDEGHGSKCGVMEYVDKESSV